MTIRKLKQFHKGRAFCGNKCLEKSSMSSHNGYRTATHEVAFVGEPAMPVCSTCATNWERWWKEAGGTVVKSHARSRKKGERIVWDDVEKVAA